MHHHVAISLAVLLLLGCAPPPAPTVALGPFDRIDSRTLFRRAVALVRSRDYQIVEQDLESGRLAVASHARSDCSGAARFELTFHRGYWIRVTPTGCPAELRDGYTQLPDAVYRDYVELVGHLNGLRDRGEGQ